MYKILIVEDDLVIARTMYKHLESWGYEVQCVSDFQNVMQQFVAFSPQLVLLDLSLPFYNGFHWCDEIRKNSQVPVIFISSAPDNMNIVMAMTRGADDFIAKPFDLDVLVAKVQAMLRRTYAFGMTGNLMEHKGVVLNLGNSTLTFKEQVLDDSFVDDNTLTVNMTRLRRKLESFGLADFILTKKGLGYRIS